MRIRSRIARWWYLGLVLAILMAGGFQYQTAYAASVTIGPHPAGGTIRVYVQQNVSSNPGIQAQDGAASSFHDFNLGAGGWGWFDMVGVKTGDTIVITVFNMAHPGPPQDPGYQSPPGHWWCGYNGRGDGIKDFSGMEAAVEAAGALEQVTARAELEVTAGSSGPSQSLTES